MQAHNDSITDDGFARVYEACLELAIRDYQKFVRCGYIVGDQITEDGKQSAGRCKSNGYTGSGSLAELIYFLQNDMDEILKLLGLEIDGNAIRKHIGMSC